MSSEVLNTPLDFIVIGSGEVVRNYWLRSAAAGSLNISSIVSLESAEAFRQRNPVYKGDYHQSRSIDNTLSIVAGLAEEQHESNIAFVTHADVRLSLATGILTNFDQVRLFIEKPYVATRTDLDAFGELVKTYSSRIHLASEYAHGRADILYACLPEDAVPTRIIGRLIEGIEYFEIVKQQTDPQYLKDGPELDLGFHLMDIIGAWSQRFGGIRTVGIKAVYDLSQRIAGFERDYGFGAKLVVVSSTGVEIPVDLQAGKANVPTERFIEFDYGGYVVRQEYTPGDSRDPVYIIQSGRREIVVQHPSGYDYYAQQLLGSVFCHQTEAQQRLKLFSTRVCLNMKRIRQG